MRNLLAFLAAAVLAFLGFGWYLGWYSVRPVVTEPGSRSYTIDINGQKIGKDVVKYGQKVQQLIDQKPEEAKGSQQNKAESRAPRDVPVDLGEEAEDRGPGPWRR